MADSSPRSASLGISKRLGEMLVESGVITPEQLADTLEIQKKTGAKLGALLVEKGYISEEMLLAFLARQCGVSYLDLSEIGEIPSEILQCVPPSLAQHQTLIPIRLQNNTLTIAMADPLNVFALDDLKLMTGYEIKTVIASESEIRKSIEKYYNTSPKASLDEILKETAASETDTQIDVIKEEAQGGADIIALEAEGEDAPIIKITNLILSNAIKAKASDIHVEPYEKSLRIRYRIDGVLHAQPAPPKKFQNAVISRIKIMSQLDIAEKRLPQDGRIKLRTAQKEVDMRVSVLPCAFGEKVVMRVLDSSGLRLDLNCIGFEPETLAVYQKHIRAPHGIILITGPTGSGKSTTLYSTLFTLNQPDTNIMTIEDPVEYVIEGINQVQARPDIGLTFAAGLRSFLRQDPDIVMVGEIRDKETAEIAINAALTGHLVFSTLHTNDAPSTITRLNNMGVEPFLTTSTVIMAVAQRLIRVICKNCVEPYEVETEQLWKLGLSKDQVKSKKVQLARGRGCDQCAQTGYRGRMGIHEVLEMTEEMRKLIMERATTSALKEASLRQGMLTLRQVALRKVVAQVTTVEEMLRVTAED